MRCGPVEVGVAASVVDQDVDVAGQLGRRGGDGLGVGGVERQCRHAECGSGGVEDVAAAAGDGDHVACGGEVFGDGVADAGAAAGDDDLTHAKLL